MTGGGDVRLQVEPGAVYRSWWAASEPVRLLVRFAVERWMRRGWWMPLFALLRITAHAIVGAPVNSVLLAVWLFVVPARWFFVGSVLVVAGLEGWMKFQQFRGHGPWLLRWRLAWKFHRVWPRVWADYAAKTRQVQAEVGTNREPVASARLRPVVDHPRMGWRFWARWPVVTFRVGVPPGRTFEQFETALPAMAANLSWVHGLDLEYHTDRASFGLLHVSFRDVLAVPEQPAWVTTLPTVDDRHDADAVGVVVDLASRRDGEVA